MNKKGKVYLVGAGCGKYDLITLRGLRLLQGCDTVIYDSLIDMRLLDLVPGYAEKICVGKRAGAHSETQESINSILVDKALSGKKVVRLKGGDPFVFGRGGEEIIALHEHDIPFGIVPGISSAVAVPELAGIPVTHRRISRSFHVFTGHTADDMLPDNFEIPSKTGGTLVFLMGLNNLPIIAERLMSGGMSGDTPAAVISQGATAAQRVVRSDLKNIADNVKNADIIAPAVIVVGETAGYDLSPTIPLPLDGVTVTVTGTEHFTEKLSSLLEPHGAEIKKLGLIKIAEFEENTAFDAALENIRNYCWLVLTSVNGAKTLLRKMRLLKMDIRKLSAVRIAVIGKGTADHLSENGILPDLVPEKYTSEELGNALAKTVGKGEKVLILRAENGSPRLTEILSEHHISYDDIKIYRTESVVKKESETNIQTDILTFASASGVRAFFDGGYKVSPETKIICIGEITAEELKARGITGSSVVSDHTAESMAEMILKLKGRFFE